MALSPVETIKAIYTHMRAGEWEEINKYISDEFVAYEPVSLPFGGEWRGENVFKRLFGAVMGSFDSPSVEPIDMIGGDDWVCYILNLSFTSKATGERVTFRLIENGRVKDGKLMELHLHYFDTAEILKHIEASS